MRLGYWVDIMMLNCTDEIILAVIKTPQMIKSLGGDIIPLALSPLLFILTQEVKEPVTMFEKHWQCRVQGNGLSDLCFHWSWVVGGGIKHGLKWQQSAASHAGYDLTFLQPLAVSQEKLVPLPYRGTLLPNPPLDQQMSACSKNCLS